MFVTYVPVDTKQFRLDRTEQKTAGQRQVVRQAMGRDLNMKTDDP